MYRQTCHVIHTYRQSNTYIHIDGQTDLSCVSKACDTIALNSGAARRDDVL